MTAILDAEGTRQGIAARWSARGPMGLGLVSLLVLVFGLGAWAAFASISGAVVTHGKVKVAGERQVVQHPDGGVVAALHVREGDRVASGDVLIRLDDRRLRADLAIVEGRLWEVLARIGRLEAEQALRDELVFAPDLLAAAGRLPEVAALVEGQRSLFLARFDRAGKEADRIRERQRQIREEIGGSLAQRASLERQIALVEQEAASQRSLVEKGLTPVARVLALDRELARLEGEAGALTARIAEAEGRIIEIDIQLTGRDAGRLEEAITQLRDLRAEEAELRERRLDLLETLERLDIVAPRDGVVLGLSVFTLRAVIRPADPILYVVPTEEALVVEAQIGATSIDQVYPGQRARLRFAAFNQRTTPEAESTVLRVAPDAVEDERTGASYYTVELAITPETLATLDGFGLVAGMPVDAFIETRARSPMTYLLQPLSDAFAKALRER
jgi:HlyD family secretion protein